MCMILTIGLIGIHRVEPERRVYPLAMGFETDGSGYEVYYDIPDLSVYTGEDKVMETESRIWYFQGTNSQDIKQQIEKTKDVVPDMGHVQVILFGSRLLYDEEKYGEVLESFVKDPIFGSGAYVFFSEDLSAVMETGAAQTDSLGAFLVDIVDKSNDRNMVILQDLYNAYYNKQEQPRLPEVQAERLKNGSTVLKVSGLDNF